MTIGPPRHALRRIVEECAEDEDCIIRRANDWLREGIQQYRMRFLVSVAAEFHLGVPPAIKEALSEAQAVAGSDPDAAATALSAILDRTENPTRRATVDRDLTDTMRFGISLVTAEELRRYRDERGRAT
jgi:hypothetical protein